MMSASKRGNVRIADDAAHELSCREPLQMLSSDTSTPAGKCCARCCSLRCVMFNGMLLPKHQCRECVLCVSFGSHAPICDG